MLAPCTQVPTWTAYLEKGAKKLRHCSQWLPAAVPVPKKARMNTPMRMMTTDAIKIRMLIQPGICRHQ